METNQPDVGARIVIIKELSSILKIPVGTLYFYKNSGRLPHFKVGKHLRFYVSEVMDYFSKGIQKPSRSLKTEEMSHGSPQK